MNDGATPRLPGGASPLVMTFGRPPVTGSFAEPGRAGQCRPLRKRHARPTVVPLLLRRGSHLVRLPCGPARQTQCATLRRAIFTVPGRLVRSGRRQRLRLPENWPWAEIRAYLFSK